MFTPDHTHVELFLSHDQTLLCFPLKMRCGCMHGNGITSKFESYGATADGTVTGITVQLTTSLTQIIRK